ncbi:MAG: hypothetical protein ACRD3R_12350, partial [Terriglobales bacterium]
RYLETDAATRRQIEQRSRALKSELQRRAQNEERRPKISSKLDHDNLVRPRLEATGEGGRP